MDRGGYIEREVHPRDVANLFSKFSFFYIIKLFKKGYTQGLDFKDIYKVPKNCNSKSLGDKLEQKWTKNKKLQKSSLTRILFTCFGKNFIVLGLIQLCVRLIITIWSPYAKSKLISYFNPGQTELNKDDAVSFACQIIGLNVFHLLFIHNFNMYVLALGLRIKAAVSSLLYRKSLKLNCESLSQVTVGKVTTIINKDVEIFQQFVNQGNEIWIALVQTVLICVLIYSKIGIASWAGVTFFFIILPLQMFIGKLAYDFRLESSRKTDERLEVTQEVLSAIKIIKMYTWEKYFENKICEARKVELQKLHKLFYSRVWINVIGNMCSKTAFFIFLITYVWMTKNITAETVYYILSCFADLQSSLSESIPAAFSKAAEVYAVIKRCENVLNSPERPQRKQTNEIVCRQVYFSGVDIRVFRKTILKNICLNISQSGLIIIVGHVGSGKSSFLKAILGDLETVGICQVSGSISYASQEPWLFPSTIKNNILFGEEYEEKRYQKVLSVCSLDYDLDLLDEGDETIIGDRGINLSKGQQARISLARAIYKNSDIYLLDDCLASLDAHVSDHIFKECIQLFLNEKLCFFVTNNDEFVQEADQILLLEQGSVKCIKNFTKISDSTYLAHSEQHANLKDLIERQSIYQEAKNSGKVSRSDYYQYVAYGGGFIAFGLVMGFFIAQQAASSYSEKLLSNWVTLEQNVTNLQEVNESNLTYEELFEHRTYNLMMYCVTFILATVLFLISIFSYFFFIRTASRNIHKAMIKAVINATSTFFDSNFIGNVLTRFSKDCATIDECLPFALVECISIIFVITGGVILLTSISYIFLIEFFVLLIVAYLIKRLCQPTGRNLQRLHVMARCPMVGHVNSSLTGLSTIRASHAEEIIIDEFDRYQDQFTSAHYMLDNSLIALSFTLELFSSFFITAIILQLLLLGKAPSVGDVGLAITQAFTISSMISSLIRVISDTENLMTSVERILEYVRVEQEDSKGPVMSHWPKGTTMHFRNVSLTYGKNLMLKDVTFSTVSREKLGIVGRTGAGKSSIVSSLLRLYDFEGTIIIDGVNIKDISLFCVRNNISVIPQDPFLFSGSIRDNLDPLEEHTDAEIWRVLSELQLKEFICDLHDVVDKGVNLSAGQRQLLCLARVILRKTKIIVLDEATANVDQQTDNLIQTAIVRNFSDCAVVTIAHRLVSVMGCDKVIVMSDGRITECDKPKQLMENKNSFFHSVVK